MVQQFSTLASLRAEIAARKAAGQRIGFVPTMGALHEGHLSLVKLAQQQADAVVVSIFVNPTQFGPNEDFDRYPRTVDADMALLETVGVDVVYLPEAKEMYPKGFATTVSVDVSLTGHLCGASRPGHFDGVATVVAKLLNQVAPHLAVFGEKDYQQLAVIRRMVADLNLPVEIIGAPIAREADGLAMSSRNRYLSEQEREEAANLYHLLQAGAIALRKQPNQVNTQCALIRQSLLAVGFSEVDYVAAVDAESLQPVTQFMRNGRLMAAAKMGNTRLIDNVAVELMV